MPIIGATDYMKVIPDQISPWLPGRLTPLGTDGFGRSDNREHLRRFFEVDAASIAAAALSRLARWGRYDVNRATQAIRELRSGSGAGGSSDSIGTALRGRRQPSAAVCLSADVAQAFWGHANEE